MASTPEAPPLAGLRNRTRRSRSIAARLAREGKLHLLLLYALLRTSDLAREGMENSGSHRFADHVYRDVPSGRFGIGRWVDAVLLGLRGARSMRSRHEHVRQGILAAARASAPGRSLRVLSVPCGIARELAWCARVLQAQAPALAERATFFGLDLDPEPLAISRDLVWGVGEARFLCADAFDSSAWPRDLDVVASTGFGEFLEDAELLRFYRICRAALADGGVLLTSAMSRDRLADWLSRELAELHAHYRHAERLRGLLSAAGFATVETRTDAVGLQTLVEAR